MSITVICKIFVKNFHLTKSDENFLREFLFTSDNMYGEYMAQV